MAEVAGVVIGDLARNRPARRNRAQGHQELGDVLHLGHKPDGLVVRSLGNDMSIVFEHRPAAGGVDDDGVDPGSVEDGHVLRASSSAGPSTPEW